MKWLKGTNIGKKAISVSCFLIVAHTSAVICRLYDKMDSTSPGFGALWQHDTNHPAHWERWRKLEPVGETSSPHDINIQSKSRLKKGVTDVTFVLIYPLSVFYSVYRNSFVNINSAAHFGEREIHWGPRSNKRKKTWKHDEGDSRTEGGGEQGSWPS